ncbi:unnamed protein product, partial [Pylaiella littoralis]
ASWISFKSGSGEAAKRGRWSRFRLVKLHHPAVALESRRRSRGIGRGSSSCSPREEKGAGGRLPCMLRVFSIDRGFRSPEALRFGSVRAGHLATPLAQGASRIGTRALQKRAEYFPEQRLVKNRAQIYLDS